MSARKKYRPGVLYSTTDLSIFVKSDDNRPTDISKHKKLLAQMLKNGWRKSLPMSCILRPDGKLKINGGQHRRDIAAYIGEHHKKRMRVWFIVDDEDYDVAEVAPTEKPWTLIDFCQIYANKGNGDYEEAIEFKNEYSIPLGHALALLGGTMNSSNLDGIKKGAFRVTEREWAHTVAQLYGRIVGLCKEMRGARLMDACIACCRVDGFIADRLVEGAKRKRDLLSARCTRNGYLELFQRLYNYGRQAAFPLAMYAENAMKSRNPVVAVGKNKRAEVVAQIG